MSSGSSVGRRKLEDRIGLRAADDAVPRNRSAQPHHLPRPVHEDQIEIESHPEGVDRAAAGDQQARARSLGVEKREAEQARGAGPGDRDGDAEQVGPGKGAEAARIGGHPGLMKQRRALFPRLGAVRRAWSRNARIAALLALLSFGVYGALAPPDFTSYEDKTAAVAEGIVRGVGPEIPEDTDLTPSENAGDPSITGILQPALMVPFYAAGAGVDEIASGGDDYTYRSFVLRLYSALVTALSVGVMFLLLRTLERSERASLAVALLYAFASIAMPYAGIGIEPTGALIVMLSFLFAATAARSGGTWMLAATGVVVGLATSTRPSTLLPAMAALLLLVPVLREADARERWRLVRWTAIPFALTVLVFFGYNVQRFDDPLQTGYPDDYGLGDAPSALPGLYISPGFGLVWFSPLVVLGALGFGVMLGLGVQALVTWTVRGLQAGAPAPPTSLTSGPALVLLIGSFAGIAAAGIATWMVLAPIANPWRQAMLALIAGLGSFVLSLIAIPIDRGLGRPGLLGLALASALGSFLLGRRLARRNRP